MRMIITLLMMQNRSSCIAMPDEREKRKKNIIAVRDDKKPTFGVADMDEM